MNSDNKNLEHENQGNSKTDRDLDNDTYGHSSDPDAFKRKNTPEHVSKENEDASSKLKDANIIENDDLSSRNRAEEKGLNGKDQ
ncbi:hypothetical protein QWY86_10410 [Pedobacter aquatilis]|uniref:hypothetical protein n=1 Tax=Pedobacter aquatilis TaxID=351343 RepID=UPI0025B3FEE7|nr:hypothetical protein [Pedobacter aquatilis]MDN3587082.1 hypothetical protein [Pedobacter aquatilis]